MRHYTFEENFNYILSIGLAGVLLTPFLLIFSNDIALVLIAMAMMLATSVLCRYNRKARRLFLQFLIATRRK